MTRERGFALLMVLWIMGMLALLVAQFTTTGRTETRIAANLRANAVAQAAADGALHEAILRPEFAVCGHMEAKWLIYGLLLPRQLLA